MKETFYSCTGQRLLLKHQGSANMMGKLDRPIREGRLEMLTTKEQDADDDTMTDTEPCFAGVVVVPLA